MCIRDSLNGFRDGAIKVLVATDIASRGIDVEGVSHVFNFDLPNLPESYVHRIGRTGRAGAGGKAIAFCSVDEAEYLVDIERTIGKPIPDEREHDWHHYPALEQVIVMREEDKDAIKRRAKQSKKGKKPSYRRNRGGGGKPQGNNRRRRR